MNHMFIENANWTMVYTSIHQSFLQVQKGSGELIRLEHFQGEPFYCPYKTPYKYAN